MLGIWGQILKTADLFGDFGEAGDGTVDGFAFGKNCAAVGEMADAFSFVLVANANFDWAHVGQDVEFG